MTNISLLSKDQVLAKLNADNSLNMTFEQVTFSEPVAATGELPARNTELVITGIPGKGYKGTITVLYDRIDMAQFEIQRPSQIQVELVNGQATLQGIVDGFNLFYGANLTLDDIRNDLTPPVNLDSNGIRWTMIAAAGSYAYRGQVEVHLQAADVDLAVAVTTTTLTGLTMTLA